METKQTEQDVVVELPVYMPDSFVLEMEGREIIAESVL